MSEKFGEQLEIENGQPKTSEKAEVKPAVVVPPAPPNKIDDAPSSVDELKAKWEAQAKARGDALPRRSRRRITEIPRRGTMVGVQPTEPFPETPSYKSSHPPANIEQASTQSKEVDISNQIEAVDAGMRKIGKDLYEAATGGQVDKEMDPNELKPFEPEGDVPTETGVRKASPPPEPSAEIISQRIPTLIETKVEDLVDNRDGESRPSLTPATIVQNEWWRAKASEAETAYGPEGRTFVEAAERAFDHDYAVAKTTDLADVERHYEKIIQEGFDLLDEKAVKSFESEGFESASKTGANTVSIVPPGGDPNTDVDADTEPPAEVTREDEDANAVLEQFGIDPHELSPDDRVKLGLPRELPFAMEDRKSITALSGLSLGEMEELDTERLKAMLGSLLDTISEINVAYLEPTKVENLASDLGQLAAISSRDKDLISIRGTTNKEGVDLPLDRIEKLIALFEEFFNSNPKLSLHTAVNIFNVLYKEIERTLKHAENFKNVEQKNLVLQKYASALKNIITQNLGAEAMKFYAGSLIGLPDDSKEHAEKVRIQKQKIGQHLPPKTIERYLVGVLSMAGLSTAMTMAAYKAWVPDLSEDGMELPETSDRYTFRPDFANEKPAEFKINAKLQQILDGKLPIEADKLVVENGKVVVENGKESKGSIGKQIMQPMYQFLFDNFPNKPEYRLGKIAVLRRFQHMLDVGSSIAKNIEEFHTNPAFLEVLKQQTIDFRNSDIGLVGNEPWTKYQAYLYFEKFRAQLLDYGTTGRKLEDINKVHSDQQIITRRNGEYQEVFKHLFNALDIKFPEAYLSADARQAFVEGNNPNPYLFPTQGDKPKSVLVMNEQDGGNNTIFTALNNGPSITAHEIGFGNLGLNGAEFAAASVGATGVDASDEIPVTLEGFAPSEEILAQLSAMSPTEAVAHFLQTGKRLVPQGFEDDPLALLEAPYTRLCKNDEAKIQKIGEIFDALRADVGSISYVLPEGGMYVQLPDADRMALENVLKSSEKGVYDDAPTIEFKELRGDEKLATMIAANDPFQDDIDAGWNEVIDMHLNAQNPQEIQGAVKERVNNIV